MKIAIASGKGGTGKTTVSVNLYYFLSEKFNNKVQLMDCDVEEPNDLLFLADSIKTKEEQKFQLIPEIDVNKCTFCRKCVDWCEFNAITMVKKLNFAQVNSDLCHSCGACSMACNFGAITEVEHPLGLISEFSNTFGGRVIEGRLEIGSALQTLLIKEVKKKASKTDDIVLMDAPPGTSCPVVETISDADYVILVTEPTPFGLNDLKITVDLLYSLNIPFGVIVNKAGLGSSEVYQFLQEKEIELLGEIQFRKDYAAIYSTGNILKEIPSEIKQNYRDIVEKLTPKILAK